MLPLIDLKAQFALVEGSLKSAVNRVLDSGTYIMGEEVSALESRLAEYVGTKHCISCASGTDALFMSLLAKGIGPNKVVFTTPFTFIATAEVIALAGAIPVFVDVDEGSFNMNPDMLERAIKAVISKDSALYPLPVQALEPNVEIAGIIAVDLFGLPADYDQINKIAASYGLFVIEDAAQSFGGALHGRRCGGLADIGCTSFFPAKPLGGVGDGGAIFCDNDDTAEVLRSIRVHGQGGNKYENVRIGITGRLDAVQAAVLGVKLDIFPAEVEQRQQVAERYRRGLINIAGLTPPEVASGYKSVFAQYTIQADSAELRDACLTRLESAKIANAVYYPIPLHRQKAFSHLGYCDGDFPVSESLSTRVFSVPMHPYLAVEDIDLVLMELSHAGE